MLKKFSFWIWATIIVQFITAAFHSLSFFVKQEPENDTEKQLLDLMNNYQLDMGMGFHPSMASLFTGLSLCFTLICLFGSLLNWFLKKKNIAADLWKGVLLIEIVIFGAMFAAMLVFTFSIPIICTGIVFLFLCLSFFTVKNK